MSRTIPAATVFLLVGIAGATAQNSCAARAMSEDGKPLAGPARTSFMKKCCEDSARDRDASARGSEGQLPGRVPGFVLRATGRARLMPPPGSVSEPCQIGYRIP